MAGLSWTLGNALAGFVPVYLPHIQDRGLGGLFGLGNFPLHIKLPDMDYCATPQSVSNSHLLAHPRQQRKRNQIQQPNYREV